MKITKLCLVMTDRCTAACDFCGFSCSPENRQVMDADLMKRLIHEAKVMGIRTVGFSGGEPFLYPELLEEGVRAARAENLAVNIATNGFWGAWDDDKIKRVLTAVKPDAINFSYDFFHRKFISEEHIIRAFAACVMLGLKPSMHVADLKGEYSAGRFIHSLGNWKYGTEMNIYPLYRCGRALDMPQEWFLTSDGRHEDIGCLSDNMVSVLYNGDVYPCCRHQVYQSAMKVGNVCGKTLQEVISESNIPMICDVLMKSERFFSLLDSAKAMGMDIEDQIGCSCYYCRMLFGKEEDMRRMLPHVEALHGEMLVRSLMKEAQGNVQ